MRSFLLLLLGSSLVSSIFSSSALAMTGGTFSTNPRYSAIVKIRADFPSGDRLNCSGTFITPRHILTSAHCLIFKGLANAIKFDFINFPEVDLFWNPITTETPHVKFHVNPDYLAHPHASNANDVGIIEFDHAVSSHTLKLASAPVGQSSGQVMIAGYGCDKQTHDWATKFKVGDVSAKAGDGLVKLSGRASLCEGDSGGPLLVETSEGLRIAGISSYMNLFAGALGGSKDRAVRVDSQAPARAWINSVVH